MMYEELSQYLKQKTGWSLTNTELMKLYQKYLDPTTKQINYSQLPQDLQERKELQEKTNYFNADSFFHSNRHLPFKEIMHWIKNELLHRINVLKGENQLKKGYLLLGETRSPLVTKEQFRSSLQIRLTVTLTDAEVTEVFAVFDPEETGMIPIRDFIDSLLKADSNQTIQVSLPIGERSNPNSRGGAKSSHTNSRPASAASSSKGIFLNGTGGRTLKLPNNTIKAAGAMTTLSSNYPDYSETNITYDKKYLNLLPPPESQCRFYSTDEIENFILNKISEKYHPRENILKKLIQLFCENEYKQPHLPSQDHHNHQQHPNYQMDHTITLNQMRYVLWKTLKLNISDQNIIAFYLKFSKDIQQPIFMSDFSRVVMKEQFMNTNRPLVDDRTTMRARNVAMETRNYDSDLENFLIKIRTEMNDLVNKESRAAPHYLLHGTSKMTEIQAKQFLKNRLHTNLDDFPITTIEKIYREYKIPNGLIDMKRIVLEAMSMKEPQVQTSRAVFSEENSRVQAGFNSEPSPLNDTIASKSSSFTSTAIPSIPSGTLSPRKNNGLPSQTLLNGALVTINEMPAALFKRVISPNEIEHLLTIKCQERLKNNLPHASLRKLFRESDEETRTISASRLFEILNRFDIIVSKDDFEIFFQKHDRGDGKVDVKEFLKVILPSLPIDDNPFLPKDEKVYKKETLLAKVVGDLTGRRRSVNHLAGSNHTRFESGFMNEVESDSYSPSKTQNNQNGNESLNNKDSLHIVRPHTADTFTSGAPSPANALEFADTLLSAMKDLHALATHSNPHTANETMNHNNERLDVSPFVQVKSAPLSPRRPASAPSRGHSSYKARQIVVQLTGAAPVTEDNEEAKVTEVAPAAVHDKTENELPVRQDLNFKTRPKSASQIPTPTSKLFTDENYRKIQREHLLALADAYANAKPESINQNPQYPNLMFDHTTTLSNREEEKANDDSQLERKREVYNYSSKTVTKKRASSAPPTRAYYFYDRKKEYESHHNHGSTAAGIPIIVPHKPYQTIDNKNIIHEIKAVTPSSNPPSTRSPRSPRSLNSTTASMNRADPIWKAKTEIAKKFVDTGVKYYLQVDPVRESLRDFYKHSNKNKTTTNDQYGVYVNSLKKASYHRKKLYNKQRKLTLNVQLQSTNGNNNTRNSNN